MRSVCVRVYICVCGNSHLSIFYKFINIYCRQMRIYINLSMWTYINTSQYFLTRTNPFFFPGVIKDEKKSTSSRQGRPIRNPQSSRKATAAGAHKGSSCSERKDVRLTYLERGRSQPTLTGPSSAPFPPSFFHYVVTFVVVGVVVLL